MSSDENQLFWKAYASTIKNIMTNGPIGENTRIYVAANNTAGIIGSSKLPNEVTNAGIYQFADFLLDPTNPNWVTSKTSRYSVALEATLSALNPKREGDTSPDAQDKLNIAKEKLANRKKELDAANKEAREDWKNDDNPNKAKTFAQWAPMNAPAYQFAHDSWVKAVAEIDSRERDMGAPSVFLADTKQQVRNGRNQSSYMPGYNMNVAAEEIKFDVDGKPVIPANLTTFLAPLYSIQGYSAMLDAWTTNENQTVSKFVISHSKGDESSFKDIGFTEAQGEASFSQYPVFEFQAKAGGRVDKSTFDLAENSKDIIISFGIKHYKTVSFDPGNWNLDINDVIKKLGITPPELTKKVRPTQALFAQGVSMEVEFKNDARTAFDSDYKKIVEAGGSLNVFGFKVSGSYSDADGTESHKSTWDASKGVLSIKSEHSRMSSNVLAVMGEIVYV